MNFSELRSFLDSEQDVLCGELGLDDFRLRELEYQLYGSPLPE
jgi:hypothetical protein